MSSLAEYWYEVREKENLPTIEYDPSVPLGWVDIIFILFSLGAYAAVIYGVYCLFTHLPHH